MSVEVRRYAHGSRVPGWDDAVDLEKDPIGVPDPATTPVPEDLRAEIEGHMARYPDRRSAAIPALAAGQRRYGWCSPEAVEQVACVMALTPAYLGSVAGFYDMLETRPVGAHDIYVCTNISCSLRGADARYAELLEAAGDDARFNVRAFECLGACDMAPMASVDGIYVGPLAPGDAPTLLDDVRAGRPVLADKQLVRRLSADPEANSQDFPVPEAVVGVARAGATDPDDATGFGAPMGGDEPVPPAGEDASSALGEMPTSADDRTVGHEAREGSAQSHDAPATGEEGGDRPEETAGPGGQEGRRPEENPGPYESGPAQR